MSNMFIGHIITIQQQRCVFTAVAINNKSVTLTPISEKAKKCILRSEMSGKMDQKVVIRRGQNAILPNSLYKVEMQTSVKRHFCSSRLVI